MVVPDSLCYPRDSALRRAARARDGDGWLHGGGDPADLPGLLDRLAALRRQEGTAGRPFEVHVISLDAPIRPTQPPCRKLSSPAGSWTTPSSETFSLMMIFPIPGLLRLALPLPSRYYGGRSRCDHGVVSAQASRTTVAISAQ